MYLNKLSATQDLSEVKNTACHNFDRFENTVKNQKTLIAISQFCILEFIYC